MFSVINCIKIGAFGSLILGRRFLLASANTITVTSSCPYSVWCAVVEGCPGNGTCTPAAPDFNPLNGTNTLSAFFSDHEVGVGHTIQCTREAPKSDGTHAYKAPVTQFEWTWEPEQDKVHFDLSAVKGYPFKDTGMTMYVSEEPSDEHPNCYGAVCMPGDAGCGYIYIKSHDDRIGMRACTQHVAIVWSICEADTDMDLPPAPLDNGQSEKLSF